ncbi:transcriptional regulator [Streptomyces populi]
MNQPINGPDESAGVGLAGAAATEVADPGADSAPSVNLARTKRPVVEEVPISSILPGVSLRSRGPDAEHVARLAETEESLPPILVDRRTMHVIDGMHRLMAAFVRGQRFISVQFFEGSAEDAFLCAVQANVAHGLPLSGADRRAAAAKIVKSHPHLSDRVVARASGLGARTVAAIRRNSDGVVQLHARVGRDGKVRPLSSDEGRKRAAELIAERPDASLREIARLAGLSPATVSDVRKRLQAGEAPVVKHGRTAHRDEAVQHPGVVRALPTERKEDTLDGDPHHVLEKLLRDPSLRHKEEGRNLLRLLHQNAVGMQQWSELTAAVPPHCGALVMNLARQYAETWSQFAQNLGEQMQSSSRRTAGE